MKEQSELSKSKKDEILLTSKKKQNRFTIFSLLIIPILIVIYSILRERDTSLINSNDIKVPLTNTNKYKLIQLKNKIDVLLVSSPETERSAISLAVKAGSLYENIPGVAHFLEHSVFLGTKKYPKRDGFTDSIYKYSGYYNAFTAPDMTVYFYSVENKGLENTIGLFSSMFDEPLFDNEYMKTEISAVNNEHEKNINNDLWIIDQIIKYQANESHPYYGFFTGNKDTLSMDNNTNVKEEVSNFFNYFYKGENMKLCIIANETIDNLEKMVNKYFNFNSNKNPQNDKEEMFSNKINAMKNEVPYNDKNLGKIIWYKSLSGVNTLVISFPLKEIKTSYKTKPYEYFSYLLHYQGNGSLINFLKKEGLIIDLFCDSSESYSSFSILSIIITMTDKGVNNCDKIINYVFEYIDLIKNKDVSSSIFIEVKKISDNKFNFQNNDDPSNMAINATLNLLNYDYEDVLYGNYRHSQYKKDVIKNYLKGIELKKSIILLSTEKNMTKSELFNNTFKWRKLPYYNNEYFITNLNQTFINQTENKKSNLTLRNKNKYLTSLNKLAIPCYENKKCQNITKLSGNEYTEFNPKIKNYHPSIIENSTNYLSYYKIDKSFKIPKINIIIKLFSPNYFLSGSINNEILLGLLYDLFTLKITEKLSDAIESNNPIISSLSSDDMIIKIQCFTDLCEKMTKEITNIIFNSSINNNDLNYIKSLLINQYEDDKVKLAFYKNRDLFTKIISKNLILPEDILSNSNNNSLINNISLDQLNDFYQLFTKDLEITSLIHGDTNEILSKQLSKLLSNYLQPLSNNHKSFTNKKREQYDLSQNVINKKIYNYYLINKFENENNHATTIFFQISKYTIKNIIYIHLYNKCIGNLFFNELRTNKGLGYIVNNKISIDNNVIYYSITVQGITKYPDEIENEINESIENSLKVNCSSNFSEIKDNLINDIMKNENNLLERSNIIFREINNGGLMFEKWIKLLKELKGIKNYEEVNGFMKLMLVESPKRIGILNYAGNMKEEEVDKRIKKVKGKMYNLNNNYEVLYEKDDGFIKGNNII